MANRLPKSWATTKDVAAAFSITERHFRYLKKDWIETGHMLEGKHFFRFGSRRVRFDLEAMCDLGHSMGRIIPSRA